MKQRARVIQIAGVRGMILIGFLASCTVAGFIGFPALVAMYGWNFLAVKFALPTINIFQGILLWAVVAGVAYLINERNGYISLFNLMPAQRLSEEEFMKMMHDARLNPGPEMFVPPMMTEEDFHRMMMHSRMNNGGVDPFQDRKFEEEEKEETYDEFENINK